MVYSETASHQMLYRTPPVWLDLKALTGRLVTMRKLAFLFVAFAPLTLVLASSGSAQEPPSGVTRIGTFDSRAVALAYYRSPDGIARMGEEWDQQHEEAVAAGDSARLEELELFKPSMQHLMHQQVFSTGSICNVMRELEEELPGIAKKADVSLIVSKWELSYSDPAIEVVDVTSMLIALLDLDEDTLRMVAEMHDVEPVPLEDVLVGQEE